MNAIGSVTRLVRLSFKARAWKRLMKETRIRRQQDKAIHSFDRKARKLVVFLIPGADKVSGAEKISGGTISIVSLREESSLLKDVHHAEVIMCTLPNEYLLFRHKLFVNQTDVFRFAQLRRYFSDAKEVLFHLPEFTCTYFMEYLEDNDRQWIEGLEKVHINVMNQNVLLMPSPAELGQLKQLAQVVTATTAHQRYCSAHYRQVYNIPLHKLSVWISPEKYTFRKYGEKENLIVVSPDEHPMKEKVLDKLAAIPGLRVQIIRNLTYEQYKSTIARAKWALTFGEGLDGYIIEPIFSGAVAFAVYNEEFFTPDFKELPTVYRSYDHLLETIVNDIERLDNGHLYKDYQQVQFDLCAKYYSAEQYRKNIKSFYENNYTFK